MLIVYGKKRKIIITNFFPNTFRLVAYNGDGCVIFIVDLRVLIATLLIAVILTYDFNELSENLPTLQVTA